MDQDQQSRRWLTRKRVLWTVGILAVIVGAYLFLRLAYVREWKWTGLVKNPGFHKRTLWDWLNLLVVPAVLALGGYLFTRSENRRTREDADQQRSVDREIADDRRQDDTLQAYLDGMSQLLTDKERPLHRAQPGDSLSTVARARTLTVLLRLDGERKARVVQFLYESGLIEKDRPVLDLSGADLSNADLSMARLPLSRLGAANLNGAILSEVDMPGVNLYRADLREANLHWAHLGGADLRKAYLREANLMEADLSYAYLNEAILCESNLRNAYLAGADLREANLMEADLSGARLRWVRYVTEEQLDQAKFLKGATMPNGQEYEDWLKDKERREKDAESD